MLPKQTNYIVGIYLRLSKDDERAGESLSIENQRRLLSNYVAEQGWTMYDEYVDDGISGVSFERPGVQRILKNPIYLGKLAQLRTTSVSYKNHKTIQKSPDDWAIVENNHEPIITQELWDKCREVAASVSQGKRDHKGVTAPLSGFLYCDSCGSKMRQHNGGKGCKPAYTCGMHSRCGGDICSTHFIKQYLIEATVLADIQNMSHMVLCEADAKAKFLAYKSRQHEARSAKEKKREAEVKNRLDELEKLIQNIYEDKVLGRVPEDVCIGLLEKYSTEKKSLSAEYEVILEREKADKQDEADIDEFMSRLRKYAGADELTREMCLDLISYVTGQPHKTTKNPCILQVP